MLKQERLYSLDFFRGLIMFLLVGESAGVYSRLHEATHHTFLFPLIQQFHHHPWDGMRFWDLVQPAFMFIVGVAMAYSLRKRAQSGNSKNVTLHILKRCLLLFLFGTGLHCIYNGKLVFELWNVLTQLSFTILFSYLIFKLPIRTQLIISIVLLVMTELLYRLWPVDGYNMPFTPDHNFGSWMDMLTMGKLSGGHWVMINCIPTAAHTIWGVLIGKLLQSEQSGMDKFKTMLMWGGIALVLGSILHFTGLTPAIKRICTSSFILISGGWVILMLAVSYWLIDIKKVKSIVFFFAVVGMNPIFIYLFGQILGGWLRNTSFVFVGGVLMLAGVPEMAAQVVNTFAVWAIMWGLCYWLYKKNIFLKI